MLKISRNVLGARPIEPEAPRNHVGRRLRLDLYRRSTQMTARGPPTIVVSAQMSQEDVGHFVAEGAKLILFLQPPVNHDSELLVLL